VRSWSTFGARTNYEQTWTHKIHHGLNLGEVNTFPLIVFSMCGHRAYTQMLFCFGSPRNPKNFEIRIFATLEVHNFLCKLLIEVRSKSKSHPSLRAFQKYVTHHLHVNKLRQFPTFNGRKSNWQFDSRPFFWP